MNQLCLIDDEELIHRMTDIMVNRVSPHTEVSHYMGAQQALEDWKKKPNESDLVLLDLNMPSLDGWQFMEEISKDIGLLGRSSKVYIYSSSVDPTDIKRAANYSFVSGFISKPLAVDELIRILAG